VDYYVYTVEITEWWQIDVSSLNLAPLSYVGATAEGSSVLITTGVCDRVEYVSPALVAVSESSQRLDFA